MANETKIGLLVGVTIIIAFAILLANRGREDHITPQLAQGVLRESQAAYAQHERTDRDGQAVAAGERSDHDRAGRASDDIIRRNLEKGQQENVLVDGTGGRWANTPEAGADRDAMRGDDDQDRPSTNVLRGSGNAGEKLQMLLDNANALLGRGADDDAGEGERADGPASRDARGRRARVHRYTVAEGDTLSGIAERFYGTQKMSVLQAIYEANRGVMADINSLGIGDQLVLPDIAGVGGPKGARAESNRPEARPRKRSRDRGGREHEVDPRRRRGHGTRWYTIKEHDALVSIAREQLQDASRWMEIYELNKDKFPGGPDRIRPGVRIKLPSAELAAARRGSR